MITKILTRRDTLANWLTVNPVLGIGEVALVSLDPAKPAEFNAMKVGNGLSVFADLPILPLYGVDTIQGASF